ncbi:hypothetical protein M5689_010651 [Euphorbia peplus]|nr:hypothetical protein M5689_010651 [Euphorbia peplus]
MRKLHFTRSLILSSCVLSKLHFASIQDSSSAVRKGSQKKAAVVGLRRHVSMLRRPLLPKCDYCVAFAVTQLDSCARLF